MINRTRGVSLWHQIRQALQADIASGVYGPGQKLPSEHQLAQRFGVNRHTVRRALEELARNGSIRVEQGRGSFVREPVIDYPVKERTRFSENLASQRRAANNVLLQAVDVAAEPYVADALMIGRGDTVVRVASAGEADGRRISYANAYFPKARFPYMAHAFRETGSVTRSFARFGVTDYSRKSTRITARMPTAEEARILDQARSRPVLVTESVNVDPAGDPVEFGVCLFASDWVQLVVESPESRG